ncbi:hypothetical protein FMM56_04285 [Campylobacter sp. LR264d]|uniref:hypothetical protein n=1 Tax=Campylobacter sp. LR264d TaxID=2593544 RepID=UPI00123AA769|nr:hypothetical protein [Campylobacter sp. LR264d]KAA6231378.1 hypothetical protein FMM56_04285 [Campylobacter sp. LR264d]
MDEIRNLDGQSINSLINAQVDFEVDGNNAKGVFIMKKSFSLDSFNDGSLSPIKLKAYIYLVCSLLFMIPSAGWFFWGIGFVFLVLASMSIAKIAKVSLVPNIFLAFELFFFGMLFIFFNIAALLWGGGYTLIIIGFIMFLASIYFYYRFYKVLALATNERFFLYTFLLKQPILYRYSLFLYLFLVGL